MSTPVSGLSLSQNLYLKGMLRPSFADTIIAEDYNFNRLSQLVDKSLKGAPAIKVSGSKILVPKMGNIAVANVSDGTQVLNAAGELVVTFTQTDNRFRVSEIVTDSKGVEGYIVARTDNSVTLASVTTTLSASDFALGSRIAVTGQGSIKGTSSGLSSLTYVPDKDYALLAKTRDSYDRNTEDNVETFIEWRGDYWYASQQSFMLRRYSNRKEYDLLFSQRGEDIQTRDGKINRTGGVLWTAKNNGGNYMPTSREITNSDFDTFIRLAKSKFPTGAGELSIGVGKQALADIQRNVFRNQIVQTGTFNTFGGASIVGYDAYKYAIGGTTVNIFELPVLNNTVMTGSAPNDMSTVTGFPKLESMCIALDMTPTPSVDGGRDIPTIQRYTKAGQPETAMRYVSGMNLFDSSEKSVEGSEIKAATSDLDSASWQIEEYGGIYIVPAKCSVMELIK